MERGRGVERSAGGPRTMAQGARRVVQGHTWLAYRLALHALGAHVERGASDGKFGARLQCRNALEVASDSEVAEAHLPELEGEA